MHSVEHIIEWAFQKSKGFNPHEKSFRKAILPVARNFGTGHGLYPVSMD